MLSLSLSLLAPFPPRQGAVCYIQCIMFLLPSLEFLDCSVWNMFSSNAHPRHSLISVSTPQGGHSWAVL